MADDAPDATAVPGGPRVLEYIPVFYTVWALLWWLLGGLGTCVHARVTAEANAAKLQGQGQDRPSHPPTRPRSNPHTHPLPHPPPTPATVTKLGHLVTTRRSSPWRRTISSLCPSRGLRSLTFSPGHSSRRRFWRICLCKSSLVLASRPNSSYLLPSGITRDTSVLVSSALRR